MRVPAPRSVFLGLLTSLGVVSLAASAHARPGQARPPEPIVAVGANPLRYHSVTPYVSASFTAASGTVIAGRALTVRPFRDVAGVTRVSTLSATHAVVEFRVTSSIPMGELHVHACGQTPDSASDITVVADESTAPASVESAHALIPLNSRGFCITPTVAMDVQLRVHGYVTDDGRGPAFSDITDSVLGTSLPVPLSGGSIPAGVIGVALMVEGRSAANQQTTINVGSCTDPAAAGVELLAVAAGDYIATTFPIVPTATGRCLRSTGAFEGRITLLGTHRNGGESSSTMPPNMRFARTLPPRFSSMNPQRVLDTRSASAVSARGKVEIDLSAIVPFAASAVVMNVTAVSAVQDGFLTVYPCDIAQPNSSNLNYAAGATIANAVTVAIGASRKICLYAEGSTHILADLSGWYAADGSGDGLAIATPTRALDTRSTAMPTAASTTRVDLSARIPAEASSVVLNVTAVGAWGDGYLTVYPCSEPQPNASTLNFAVNQTVPNFVTVKVGSDRSVCLFTSAPTHMLADLQAWYLPSSSVGFLEMAPWRAFDSRRDVPGKVNRQGIMWLTFDTKPVAWLMNVTAVSPEEDGYLSAYPCETSPVTAPPNTSNLNYVAGQIVPNQVLVGPGSTGAVCFYSFAASHLLADLAGSFTDTVSYAPFLAEP